MALTYDQLSAVTHNKFIPKLVDNIFDSDPLMKRAKDRGWYTSCDGGLDINQPLLYAANTAGGSYNPTDTLDTSDNDQMTAATYPWKFYYANITITRADELKNSGDSQILNFVKQKTMAAEMTMKDNLQNGLYSDGSTSSDIAGLAQVVSASNTVGGIDQSVYSWWQSQVDTTATLTLAILQSMYNTLTIDGSSPSVIMATRANYNRYYALLQPQQRFMDAETAKGGFQSLMFNGTPFIAGSKVTANGIYMLNEQFINLYYHPKEDFRFEEFIKPTNQNVKTAKIYWAGNFGTSNARQLGVFNSLTA